MMIEDSGVETRHPNFIIGGSAASGTSFLSAVLLQHPAVYLPVEMRPEPHFFYKSWEFEKGWHYYLGRWFKNVPKSSIAVGERSSSYLFGGRDVALKMRHQLPDLRLIFVLRNPIERTWANYRYTVLEGLENLPFEEALETEQERITEASGIWSEIQPHNYTGRGYYGQQIAEFLEVFDRQQVLILKSEELSRATNQTLAKTCMFLNIPWSNWAYARPPEFTSMNVVNAAKQMELRRVIGERFDQLIEAIRLGQQADSLQLGQEERDLFGQLQTNLHSAKMEMPSAARSYLRNLFKSDLERLKMFIDFDISDWE